jgi:HAD superfamily hydrolase (TIGR01490 family)
VTTWPEYPAAPAVAFVDVDGTLLAETTTYLFARIMRRMGLIKRSFVLRAAYHGLQHKLGRLDYGQLVAFGLRNIASIPVAELERIAFENFRDHVRPRLYEGVVEHFQGLRERGTAVVLVSSSPGIVIRPLANYLGCEDTLTTPVVCEHGRLVGVGEGPPCYGEGKLFWARRWSEARGVDLSATAAYADNWSDRALLERVGRPVAVHPHRMLKKLAIRRGWTIVDPQRPPRAARREGRRPSPPSS